MDRLLQTVLSRLIRNGRLRITTALGNTFTVGDGTGDLITIRFTNPAAQLALLLASDYTTAITDEVLYVDAGFHIEGMVFH